MPPGVQTIHADVGLALEGLTRVALRSPSDCGDVVIMPSPAGHITGTFAPAEGGARPRRRAFAVPVTHDWTQRDLSDSRRTTVSDDGVFAFDGVKPGRYLVTVNVVSPPRVSQRFPPAYYPGVERREDAVVIEVSHGRVSPSEPFALKRTLPRTTIQAEIVCRDGSLPRSGLVYAKPADYRAYFHESTYERVDGRFRVTVIQGVSYDVHGEVPYLRAMQPDARSASRACERQPFASNLTACLPSSTSSRRSIAAGRRQSTAHGGHKLAHSEWARRR